MNIFESLEQLNVSEECFNDIMDIVEEYINEVSVKKWKKAAINSLARRGFNAGYVTGRDDARGSGAVPDGYMDVYRGKRKRLNHALEVSKLPDSKQSARRILKAARNVYKDRVNAPYAGFPHTYDDDQAKHVSKLLPRKPVGRDDYRIDKLLKGYNED